LANGYYPILFSPEQQGRLTQLPNHRFNRDTKVSLAARSHKIAKSSSRTPLLGRQGKQVEQFIVYPIRVKVNTPQRPSQKQGPSHQAK
jgi:hypothetical protein